jgi:hypothetical protein
VLAAFYAHEDAGYSFLSEVDVTPTAIVLLEGLDQLKKPATSLGIEPGTYLLVA